MFSIGSAAGFSGRGRLPSSGPATARSAALLAALAGAVASCGAARATELAYPKDKPRVTLQVPDDWTITYSPAGFEARSPQNDSFVVGDVLKKSKPAIDAWNKIATERVEADGVSFDKNWKPAPKPAEPPDQLAAAQANLPKPSDVPLMAQNAIPHEKAPAPPPQQPAPTAINGMSFKVAQYFGAIYKGKPIDVQVVVMNLNKDQVFAVEQLSTGSDARAVDIVMSSKPVREASARKP